MTTNTTITPELLDQLLANYEKPEDLTGDDGLFKQLKKALIERALGAELTEHLGYEKGDPTGRGSGKSRNGTSSRRRCPRLLLEPCAAALLRDPGGIPGADRRAGARAHRRPLCHRDRHPRLLSRGTTPRAALAQQAAR